MRRIQLLLSGLVALTAVSMAAAAPLKAAGGGGQRDLIEALRSGGAQVVALGARGGLDGYFVTPAEGAGYSLYLTGDGHAVAGLLYGPDGIEITGAQLAAARSEAPGGSASPAAPRTDAAIATAHAAERPEGAGPPSPGLFERTAGAFGFTLGERGPVVVLFGDPACPWSRSAAARLGRAALDGRLQLRVVPVAVLGAEAARLAAGIAAQPRPRERVVRGSPAPGGPPRRRKNRPQQRAARRMGRGRRSPDRLADARRGVAKRVGDIDDVGLWLRETLGPDTLRVGGGP